MLSLIISIQLWIICLHLDNISALFVFRRLGWHLTLTWHYSKYLVINWYIKVWGVPDMAVWSYTCMKNIAMKWEIYTATPKYGKVCFIDVTGHNLRKRLTIGNIYRPPHDNNNNKNIETFINEMSPIIDKLKKENSFAAILGDFNINLLQINEREKYEDFFDMMCTNNFYPKIMFPTRIAARSHSLLDQIFCKVPCKRKADISASILLSGISDHFPCVVNFKILNKKPVPPKYVYQRTVTESSLDQYRSDLHNLNIHTHLKADLMTDPNESYQIFENLIQTSYQQHFPKKNALNLIRININYRIG